MTKPLLTLLFTVLSCTVPPFVQGVHAQGAAPPAAGEGVPMPDAAPLAEVELGAPLPEGAAPDAPAPNAAAPAVASQATPVESSTERLLRFQREAEAAGAVVPVLGVTGSLSYRRYLNSFTYPIPEEFEDQTGLGSEEGS